MFDDLSINAFVFVYFFFFLIFESEKTGYPPESYGKDAYPPPGYPPPGYPPQGYPPPAQGYPPPQYAPQYAQPPPSQQNSAGAGCLEGWCVLSLSLSLSLSICEIWLVESVAVTQIGCELRVELSWLAGGVVGAPLARVRTTLAR